LVVATVLAFSCTLKITDKELIQEVDSINLDGDADSKKLAIYLIAADCFCNPMFPYEIKVNEEITAVYVRNYNVYLMDEPKQIELKVQWRKNYKKTNAIEYWDSETIDIPDNTHRVFLYFANDKIEQLSEENGVKEIAMTNIIRRKLSDN